MFLQVRANSDQSLIFYKVAPKDQTKRPRTMVHDILCKERILITFSGACTCSYGD